MYSFIVRKYPVATPKCLCGKLKNKKIRFLKKRMDGIESIGRSFPAENRRFCSCLSPGKYFGTEVAACEGINTKESMGFTVDPTV